MWSTLAVTMAVFVFFGLKVEYEEDISKLLPQTDSATESGLAFGSLKVKDKIFIQIRGREETLDAGTLAGYMDEFTDSLEIRDTSTGYISGILSGISPDMMLMTLDYALMNLPSLVDTSAYREFDALLAAGAIDRQMERNAGMVFSDEEGSISTMVGYDPAALRKVILSGIDRPGGFTVAEGHLFSPDSTVVLAFLSPDFNSMDSKSGSGLVRMLEKEIDSFSQRHPDAEILFHGNPVQSVFNSRQIKKDLAMTVGISLIIICLVICFCFRSKSTLLFLLLPVVYGAFFALACVYWLQGGMSLMAIGIGALVLGVALSYCLHVLTHSKYVDDPEKLLRDQSTPVCLGCLTTIGAFMGLLFTQSSLLRDFGIFASLAMVGTTLFALVFLPHFFTEGSRRRNDRAFAWIDRINSYPLDRKKWLLAVIAAVCAVCCYTQKWVTFDSDLRNIGYNEPKVVESRELYSAKNNDGYFSMYYAATGRTLDEAIVLNGKVTGVLDSLRSAGLVHRYSSAASLFVPEKEQERRIAAWNAYWTPRRVAAVRNEITVSAEKYGLDPFMFETFFTLVGSDYAPSSLYDAGVLPDELVSNFIEKTPDGRFMVFDSVLMQEKDKKAVSDAVAACPGAVVIDPFYYTNDMVRILNDDFNVILGVSTLFVFIVLLVSFRSVVLSVIAFLPMGLSWYVVKGIMGIFGLQFNLINIIIATFIFGIGVDYSIFVMKGLLAKASGEDDRLLTYHKAAIFFSAFVLIVVVVSLLFATHPAISSIGISTLIGMGSTILITYTLQPFLFRQMMKIPYFSRRFGHPSGCLSEAAVTEESHPGSGKGGAREEGIGEGTGRSEGAGKSTGGK